MPWSNDVGSGVSAVLPEITQGRRIWRRQACGFGAQLVTYAPGREMARHAHLTANITVILTGSFEEEIDCRDHFCDPLSVVIKPSGTRHKTRAGDTETRTVVLEIDSSLEDELRRRFGLFDDCRWFPEARGLAPIVLGLCRSLRDGKCGSEQKVFDWFAQLGTAAAAPGSAGDRGIGVHVRRAVEHLRRDGAVSTGDLAQRLGLHPVYLARLFRERLGCSPGRVRQTIRLSSAIERIVRTNQSLAHVALGTGFSDQSHLARHVRRFAGLSAGALRQLASE